MWTQIITSLGARKSRYEYSYVSCVLTLSLVQVAVCTYVLFAAVYGLVRTSYITLVPGIIAISQRRSLAYVCCDDDVIRYEEMYY